MSTLPLYADARVHRIVAATAARLRGAHGAPRHRRVPGRHDLDACLPRPSLEPAYCSAVRATSARVVSAGDSSMCWSSPRSNVVCVAMPETASFAVSVAFVIVRDAVGARTGRGSRTACRRSCRGSRRAPSRRRSQGSTRAASTSSRARSRGASARRSTGARSSARGRVVGQTAAQQIDRRRRNATCTARVDEPCASTPTRRRSSRTAGRAARHPRASSATRCPMSRGHTARRSHRARTRAIDRLARTQSTGSRVVIEHRYFEVVDEDLRVLRRAAANDDAGAAERQWIARDARHRRQRAHHVVAGTGNALQLGVRSRRRPTHAPAVARSPLISIVSVAAFSSDSITMSSDRTRRRCRAKAPKPSAITSRRDAPGAASSVYSPFAFVVTVALWSSTETVAPATGAPCASTTRP